MGNMMSLNISDDVIKAAIQEEVHAGIVKALGEPSVIVRDAIKTMTNKYVNERGEFVGKDNWRAKPYFDWLAEDIVKTTVKEEIEKYVNENREEFAEVIRKLYKTMAGNRPSEQEGDYYKVKLQEQLNQSLFRMYLNR